jgi:hypothetical protein
MVKPDSSLAYWKYCCRATRQVEETNAFGLSSFLGVSRLRYEVLRNIFKERIVI